MNLCYFLYLVVFKRNSTEHTYFTRIKLHSRHDHQELNLCPRSKKYAIQPMSYKKSGK